MKYIIVVTEQIKSINFNDSNINIVRKSFDESKTILSWTGEEIPVIIQNINSAYKTGPYSQEELSTAILNSEWYPSYNFASNYNS